MMSLPELATTGSAYSKAGLELNSAGSAQFPEERWVWKAAAVFAGGRFLETLSRREEKHYPEHELFREMCLGWFLTPRLIFNR